MTERAASELACVEEIRVLVFNTMGTRMAVDVGQISEMIDPERARERNLQIVPLHSRLSFRNCEVSYSLPRVLMLKDVGDNSGILIDRPEDIKSIKIGSIQALPPLLEAVMESRAIWGACLLEDEIVLLIDLTC